MSQAPLPVANPCHVFGHRWVMHALGYFYCAACPKKVTP